MYCGGRVMVRKLTQLLGACRRFRWQGQMHTKTARSNYFPEGDRIAKGNYGKGGWVPDNGDEGERLTTAIRRAPDNGENQ